MKVNYVALIEDGSDDTAYGVVFPDLSGCFSAGDTYEEAVKNASEALGAYCELMLEDGHALPSPRPMDVISRDQTLLEDFFDSTYRFVTVSAEVPAAYSQDETRPQVVRQGFEESSE